MELNKIYGYRWTVSDGFRGCEEVLRIGGCSSICGVFELADLSICDGAVDKLCMHAGIVFVLMFKGIEKDRRRLVCPLLEFGLDFLSPCRFPATQRFTVYFCGS